MAATASDLTTLDIPCLVQSDYIRNLWEDRRLRYRERDRIGHRVRAVLANDYQEGWRDVIAPGTEPVVANLIKAASGTITQRAARYPRISVDPVRRRTSDAAIKRAENHEVQLGIDLRKIGFRATNAQAVHWLVNHGLMALWLRPSPYYGVPLIVAKDPLSCVDSDTEILTRQGWLRYTDLKVGDEVAGFDMGTGKTRWTDCQAVNVLDFDGKLLVTEKKGLSMALTPDHRCVTYRRTMTVNRPVLGPSVKRADELDTYDYVPQHAKWERRSTMPFVTPQIAAICGWVAAEGTYHRYDVEITQSLDANPAEVRIISALLGVEPSMGTGTHEGIATWRLPDEYRAIVKLLMPDKLLGPWCFDLTPPAQKALLRAFISGDGSEAGDGWSIVAATRNRRNLDILQVLAFMQGYRATISTGGRPGFCHLYISRARTVATSLRTRTQPVTTLEPYTGKVWCPTTGTGTWVARRNGTIFITGNCYPGTVWPHKPEVYDVLFAEKMPAFQAIRIYPQIASILASLQAREDHKEVVLGEYVDENGLVVALLEPRVEIVGWYPSVIPGQNTVFLGRGFSEDLDFHGQFDHSIPVLIAQAKLTGLVMTLAEHNVFAETNVFGEFAGNQSKYNWGPGAVNFFMPGQGARVEKSINQMSPQVFQELDRFERAIRMDAGYPGQMSGEPVATIATGKGMEELTVTVDDNVNYLQTVVQDVLIRALTTYSEMAIAMRSPDSDNYQPKGTVNIGVRHLSSSDPAQFIKSLQQIDSGVVARRTIMDRLDEVAEAEVEERLIDAEQLRDSMKKGIEQRLMMPPEQGGMDPVDAAEIISMRLDKGMVLEDAVKEVARRKAAAAAQQAPGAPGVGAPRSIQDMLAAASQGVPQNAGNSLGQARTAERLMSQPDLAGTAALVAGSGQVQRQLSGPPALPSGAGAGVPPV